MPQRRLSLCRHFRRAMAMVLTAVAVLAPTAARAATRVLVVETRDTSFYNQALGGFRDGLKSRGYDEGDVNLATISLTGDGQQDAKKVKEQIAQKNQLIVTFGTDATEAVMNQHPNVPVVFGMVLDPVALGAVKSLDQPGGDFTGTTLVVSAGKQIDALMQALPGVHRVGVLYTDGDSTSLNFLNQAKQDVAALNAQIVAVPVTAGMTTQQALGKLDNQVDALWVIPDAASASANALSDTLAFADQRRLPVLGSSYATVKAGALLSLSADVTDAGDLTAEMAAQILGGTGTVGQMPVRGPRKTILSINLDAARALKIALPSSLLHLADEVVDSQVSSN